LEGESFSADGTKVVFSGISAHPGYAFNKLVNAQKVAAYFLNSLPQLDWSPERTNDRMGFVHPIQMQGTAEQCQVQFIVRDFETAKLDWHVQQLDHYAKAACAAFPGSSYVLHRTAQYRNMREILDQYPQVMGHAAKAYQMAGITPNIMAIRGGTDGSRLSFMGLPCPNIFTGEMGIHSKQEYVSVQDMEKAVEVCVNLVQIWAQDTSNAV
jgi:tripeptide aminopeptidase